MKQITVYGNFHRYEFTTQLIISANILIYSMPIKAQTRIKLLITYQPKTRYINYTMTDLQIISEESIQLPRILKFLRTTSGSYNILFHDTRSRGCHLSNVCRFSTLLVGTIVHLYAVCITRSAIDTIAI